MPYRRVSTDEQSLSLDAQAETIASFCRGLGFVEVLDPFTDEDVSGATPVEKRPGLVAALAELGPGDALVVLKRDRLARDPIVCAMVEKLAARRGAAVLSVAGQGSLDDSPESILQRRIFDSFAEYERLIIKSRTRSGLAVLRSKGRRAGTTPLGQRVVDDGGRSKTSNAPNALAPDGPESAALATIYRAAVELGLKPKGIVEYLHERGIKPRGGRGWNTHTIRRVVRDLDELPAREVAARRGIDRTDVETIESMHLDNIAPKRIRAYLADRGRPAPAPERWHPETIRQLLMRAGFYRARPRAGGVDG